jgi:aspartyl/asparaginyl-tRNA synthetase
MERKLKRKSEVLLPNLNKKNKVKKINMYDDIYGEINNIKYEIFLFKQNQKSLIEKTIKKIIKKEINKLKSDLKETENVNNQIEELKEEVNSIKYEIEALLLNKNFEKKMQLGPDISYIN